MSELTVGSISGLAINNNVVSVNSGHQISGPLMNTYPGAIIKTTHYNTGYGAGARKILTTDWSALNIGGTGLVGPRNDSNNNILKYTKIHNSSQLKVDVRFPYYVANGANGFGIRCQTIISGTGYIVDILDNGPAHTWGAGGYGGPDAGIFTFSWSTGDNSNISSIVSSYTGDLEFWFQGIEYNSADTITLVDYSDDFPKYGVIDIFEVAE